MNPLAGALREAMVGSPHDLVVLDRDTDTWQRRLVARGGTRIAERLRPTCWAGTSLACVGLVGEPTVELIAAIQGSWLAALGVSILPRPQARRRTIGVGAGDVGPVPQYRRDHGVQLRRHPATASGRRVPAGGVRHRRCRTHADIDASAVSRQCRRGHPAGDRRIHRNSTHRSAGTGGRAQQHPVRQPAIIAGPQRRRVFLVADLPRHGPGDGADIDNVRRVIVAGAHGRVLGRRRSGGPNGCPNHAPP